MIDIFKIHSKEVARKQGDTNTEDEFEYTIPNGQSLALFRFNGGHEHATAEVRTELIERDGGTDTLIEVGYGPDYSKPIERDFVGDGTKKIVIKHVNGDAQPLHMTASFFGRVG